MAAVMLACAFSVFGASYTWNGGNGDGDWTSSANWGGATIPPGGPGSVSGTPDDVIIPTGMTFWPTLAGADIYFGDLTIQSGAIMDMNSVNVHIDGNLDIQTASGNVTNFDSLELTGSSSTVHTNGVSITSVSVSNAGGAVQLDDDLHVSSYLEVPGTLDLNGHTAGVAGGTTVICNTLIVFNGGSVNCAAFTAMAYLDATGGAVIAASGNVDMGSVLLANFTAPNLCSLVMSGGILTVNTGIQAPVLGSLEVTGAVALGSPLRLASGLTITSGSLTTTAANNVTLVGGNFSNSAGAGGYDGLGTLTLNGTGQTVASGTATTLPALDVTGATGPVTFTGALTINSIFSVPASLVVNLNGNITVDGGNLSLGSVTLAGTSVLSTTSSGDITLGTVTNAQALTVNAADSVIFNGLVGGGTPLSSLTVTAGTVNFNNSVNTSQASPGSKIQVTANIINGISGMTLAASGTDNDIEFMVDTMTLNGMTVNAAREFILGPRNPSGDIEFGDSNFAGRAVWYHPNFVLPGTAPGVRIAGGNHHIHVATDSAIPGSYSINYNLVLQSTNAITLHNNYTSVNKNLTMDAGTGPITLGDSGPVSIALGAGVYAAASPVDLGNDVTVTVTPAAPAAGITFGNTITGNTHNLTLFSRAGTITVTGAATGLGTVNLHDNNPGSTGAVAFNGGLSADSLVTVAQNHNITLAGPVTITNAVTFNNTGTLTLNGAAAITFTGGVTATVPSNVTVSGAVNTADTPMMLGNVSPVRNVVLAANTTLSTDAGTGGNITLGPVTRTTSAWPLTVTAGAGNVIFNGTVGSGAALGAVVVTANGITLAANAAFTAGAITINNAGTFTVSAGAAITAGGIFSQTDASGPVSIAANISATSGTPANAVISFANTVTLAAGVTFSTPPSNGSLTLAKGESGGTYPLILESNGGVMTLSQGASSTLDDIAVTAGSTVSVAASNTVVQDDGRTLTLTGSGSPMTLVNSARINTSASSAVWRMGTSGSIPAGWTNGFFGFYGTLKLDTQGYFAGNVNLAGVSAGQKFTLDFTGGPSIMEVSGNVFIDGEVLPTAFPNMMGDVNTLTTPVTLSGMLTDFTLRMTGAGNLEANQPIGKFNAAGNTTILGDAVNENDDIVFGGDVTIEAGHSLIAGNSSVHVGIRALGGWTQETSPDGTFVHRDNSTVEFGRPSLSGNTYTIRGNTTWHNLKCAENSATLLFSNHLPGNHTHSVYGALIIAPVTPSSRITLDRESAAGTFQYPPPPAPDGFFWVFNLVPPARLVIDNIIIYHSFSLRKIPVPQNIPGGSGVDVNAQPYATSSTDPDPNPTGLPFPDPPAYSYFNVDWFVLNSFIYSFTEDSDHNGRIDRIRLQAAFNVTDGPAAFGGFAVDQIHDAFGNFYEVDTTKGYGGYRRVEEVPVSSSTDLDSIYVFLKEKPYSDGHLSLHWRIARNTSLWDLFLGRTLIGNAGIDEGWTTDTVPPRINYALAVPGHDEIFFQMSEPVTGVQTASVDSPGAGPPILSPPLRNVGGSESEFIISLASPYAVTDLYDGTRTFTLVDNPIADRAVAAVNLKDPATGDPYYYLYPVPKYPQTYGYDDATGGSGAYAFQSYVQVPPAVPPAVMYPPNSLIYDPAIYNFTGDPLKDNPYVHRVSDALVSVTPSGSNSDRYFVWPVWARYYPPANPLPAGGEFWGQQDTDTGIIWDFSGKKALEDRNAEIQVRMSGALAAAMGPADVELKYGSNVPLWQRYPPENNTNGKGSGGLWLPGDFTRPYPAGFVNLVPDYYASPSAGKTGSSGLLYNFFIDKDLPGYESVSRFDFVLRLSGAPQDLFAVRLDAMPGEVPSNWYRKIRPWSYDVHNVRLQRGGVTILNNVINPTKGEKVFIRYHLVNGGRVTVQVFTLDGNMIKVLFRGSRPQGEWIDVWDGKNNGQRPVARGMYFVRVVGPDIDEIRKIMVVK
jgi:hypothetical protein